MPRSADGDAEDEGGGAVGQRGDDLDVHALALHILHRQRFRGQVGVGVDDANGESCEGFRQATVLNESDRIGDPHGNGALAPRGVRRRG